MTLLERAIQRRRAAKLCRFYRQHMTEAIPIPLFECNESPKHGLTKGADGTIWVDTNWTTGFYIPLEIVIKHQLSPERKLSVLLHELGHWYCHYEAQGRHLAKGPQEEIEADTFAFMGLRSYGIDERDEMAIWTRWRATQGRHRGTREIVTRGFDQFWADFGMRAKKAME